MTAAVEALPFDVPEELAAREPPEARGLTRDGVRLMVSHVSEDEVTHSRFDRLPDFLEPGDLLVVNTSATINASFTAQRATPGGERDVEVHLSTHLSGNRWVIELRKTSLKGSEPELEAAVGERVQMPGNAVARLLEPLDPSGALRSGLVRLWVAELTLPLEAMQYAARFGSPIRYRYVPERWPLSHYQTVFAAEPGSVEMPSAGRPFTMGMLARLANHGIGVATLVLHTGVSSLESHEPPYAERFRVPGTTARAVNMTRALGGRVVAVGTTAVRALETVATRDGRVRAGEGWSSLTMGPERSPFVVDGLLTGLHPRNSSHQSLLEVFAPRHHLTRAHDEALREHYLWHEFGDVHLILP